MNSRRLLPYIEGGVPIREIARRIGVAASTVRGEVRQAQIFVAVMGAPNFTYVEATWTQALEGIVSKRKGSPYCSGRSPDWLKSKNPACAAVKREEEEGWGR